MCAMIALAPPRPLAEADLGPLAADVEAVLSTAQAEGTAAARDG